MKLYCPECEGYFSAHGFNLIKRCPFAYKTKREEDIDIGRAHPLLNGSIVHYIAEIFNKSLKTINPKKFNNILKFIFSNFDNFLSYMKLIINKNVLFSVYNRVYSFYLYKKDLYESFYSEECIQNMIPIVIEEWLWIPFDRTQFNNASKTQKVDNWNRIGVHNILDEVILDKDDQAICSDYKSYPRKQDDVKEIKNTYKKYQLITALLTFEYKYQVDVKFISNIDLGTKDFPNISYHKPTSRGITYYKKSLLKAYENLFDENFYTIYDQFYCLNFCELKLMCPDENLDMWRNQNLV